MSEPSRLFLYGTLMAGHRHRLARRLHEVLGPGREAGLSGIMYAVPDAEGVYPLVIPGEGWVRGMVHEAAGLSDALWGELDAYEQVVTRGDGYRRRAVTLVSGERAQAYLWQGALPPGALPVAEGEFAAFLARTGMQPFAT
ncbi:MAG: gamma-glutamylcyclotransferase [Sphingomonadales bacterium]|nr:gamma-glutamylcyclotransferase [Sphingomonadales bacterium]MDE2169048.1 gamma-glutamylcyclotransferase [Sphingomonadales bacterium]